MSTGIPPFDAVYGQERVISLLSRALAAGRIGHAYLFEGMEGTGRELTARALFQTMFCISGSGCGLCPPCRRCLSGSHPDLHLVEPDGAFIKIDQIRELQRELTLKPFEAPRKGAIIRQADRLHPAAANALLKTLEEPPGNALIILVTSQGESILATIRSRCQALSFSPLPGELLCRLLVQQGIAEETAMSVAPLAEGSMARAAELALREHSGDTRELAQRVARLSLQDVPTLFALSEEFAADRETALTMLDNLLSETRDLMTRCSGTQDEDLETHDDNIRSAEVGRLETVLYRIEKILEASHAIRRNANVRLTLDALFIRLAQEC